jgi:hypothetical protein
MVAALLLLAGPRVVIGTRRLVTLGVRVKCPHLRMFPRRSAMSPARKGHSRGLHSSATLAPARLPLSAGGGWLQHFCCWPGQGCRLE